MAQPLPSPQDWQPGDRLHAPKTSLILAADAGVDSTALLTMASTARPRFICNFTREERLNIVFSSDSSSGIGRSTVGVVPSLQGSRPAAHFYLGALESCL